MGKYLTIVKRAFASFGEHNDTSFAGAIAYNAIFSLFPLLLLGVTVLGFVIHDPVQRQRVVDDLFNVLGRGVSKDALATQVNAVAGGSAKLGIFALLIAAWSATGVFDQIRIALQIVWDADRQRPFVQQKLVDFAMLFSVGIVVLLAIACAGVLTALSSFGSALLGPTFGPALHVLVLAGSIAVPVVLLFGAFCLLYTFVPHAEVRLSQVWFGALLASIAFEIVQLLFAYYVASFGHYNQTYGALGGAIAFLFLIYIAANIVLLGGEVAKEYTEVVTGMKPATDPKQDGPQQSPLQQAGSFAESLVVDKTPHHDTSRPYEPGRNQPLQPGASLETDDQSSPIATPQREEARDGQPSVQRPPVPTGPRSGRGG